MRLRLPAILFLLVVLASPLSAFAQGEGSMFDPIIPEECKCREVQVIAADGTITNKTSPSAPNWGCVLKVIQNVINTAVGISILVVVLAIVYAAFIFMTQGGNPGARQQGRNLIGSSLVGLLIILGAWLGVDFIMKIIYDPKAVISGETRLGPWNAIWASSGDDMCIVVREPTPIATGAVDLLLDVLTGSPLVGGVGACSPTTVQSAATQAGITMPVQEATFLACVAKPESGCGAAGRNYAWGQGSSAYGPFQILLGDNGSFFENQACYTAGGVSGPLNCSSGFRNGNPIRGKEAIVARCERAAANLACSTAAAHALFEADKKAGNDGATPWAGNRDSTSAHQKCRVYLR